MGEGQGDVSLILLGGQKHGAIFEKTCADKGGGHM